MKSEIYICDACGKEAGSEKQLRHENWLTIDGGVSGGVKVWLEKPRKSVKGTSDSYMIHAGWKDRVYHFCCIECLVSVLKGKESI